MTTHSHTWKTIVLAVSTLLAGALIGGVCGLVIWQTTHQVPLTSNPVTVVTTATLDGHYTLGTLADGTDAIVEGAFPVGSQLVVYSSADVGTTINGQPYYSTTNLANQRLATPVTLGVLLGLVVATVIVYSRLKTSAAQPAEQATPRVAGQKHSPTTTS